MKAQTILGGLLLVVVPMQAQLVETFNFSTFGANPDLAIPDGNATGISDTRTISSTQSQITSLKVMLDLAGDFNGDLYLYLRHDTGLSVLLNRPGRTTGNLSGYDDSGFNVTFSDSAANGDIHLYRDVAPPAANSKLLGEWQPDARDDGFGLAFDTTPRNAFLNSFTGLNPNGDWTLFAADLAGGGTSAIESWGLQITAVPEPHHYAMLFGSGLLVFSLWRRSCRVKLNS